MITLYNFARGARGVRLFWLCEEMGLAYRVETLTFPVNAAYRALHPLGSVPFLVDGEVEMSESIAIMLYLAEKYGPTPLLPGKDDPALPRVLQMTMFGEATIGAPMNALLGAKFVAPEADKRNWSVRMIEGRLTEAVAHVDALLGDAEFLAGGRLTLADISVSTALGMWRGALGKTLSPRLAAYQDRLHALASHERAMVQAG